MSRDEWAALSLWIQARWPHVQWTPEQLSASFADLAEFPADLVAAALQRIRDRGDAYAPVSPVIRKACRDIRAERARYPEMPALPSEALGPTGREAAILFARRNGGYTPSQIAKQLAGLNPGPPRYPAEEE